MSKREQYEHLLSKLKSQIELCQTLMKYYYKTGNKNTAALYLRFKKVFMADYDSLASLRDHNQNIPAYHFQEVTYTVENAFLELSPNELEVRIEHAWNLGHKDVPGRDIVAYVNWDIGWPSENSSGSSKGKLDTPLAKKGMEPGKENKLVALINDLLLIYIYLLIY